MYLFGLEMAPSLVMFSLSNVLFDPSALMFWVLTKSHPCIPVFAGHSFPVDSFIPEERRTETQKMASTRWSIKVFNFLEINALFTQNEVNTCRDMSPRRYFLSRVENDTFLGRSNA